MLPFLRGFSRLSDPDDKSSQKLASSKMWALDDKLQFNDLRIILSGCSARVAQGEVSLGMRWKWKGIVIGR